MQKFTRGDLVRIAAKLPDSMSHFTAGEDVVIIGSYADQYGGSNREIYTVLFRTRGCVSWYPERLLTLVEAGREDLIETWSAELETARQKASDLDTIFKDGVSGSHFGLSIVALAACLGITEDQIWGSRGEGFVFEANAHAVYRHAKRFIDRHDKAGWIAYCETIRVRNKF